MLALRTLVTVAIGYGAYHILHTSQGREDAKKALKFMAHHSNMAGDRLGRVIAKSFGMSEKGEEEISYDSADAHSSEAPSDRIPYSPAPEIPLGEGREEAHAGVSTTTQNPGMAATAAVQANLPIIT